MTVDGLLNEEAWAKRQITYMDTGLDTRKLYEFDVGSQSGWMYKVNGWFPNYGCSRYALQQGDEICWMYTCVGLGEDIGGGYAAGG